MNSYKLKSYVKNIALLTLCISASNVALASDDEDGFLSGWFGSRGYQAVGPGEEVYQSECSACHVAYPAPLLPKDKWMSIMSTLDDHFGDNAELEATTQKTITTYLAANAADTNGRDNKLSKFYRRGGNTDGLRITQLKGFKRKHHEINETRMVINNPDVGSFSQCSACHGEDAQKGIFDEDTVNIPNFANWDD